MIQKTKTPGDFKVIRLLRKSLNFSLKELSARSGVSFAVISKLERNHGNPSLETLSALARALHLAPSELLALAEPENLSLEVRSGAEYPAGGFTFRAASLDGLRLIHGRGPSGARLADPEKHRGELEMLSVLSGRLRLTVDSRTAELEPGMSVRFQAFLEHSYEALEDVEMFIVHFPKRQAWPIQHP